MNEKELLNDILKYFSEQYKIKISYPYNDGYLMISKDDREIGDFNSSGRNLLSNLSELCNILKRELD